MAILNELFNIFVLSSLLVASQKEKYVAKFSNNDITGVVAVDLGTLTVSLDLTGMPDLPNGFENCTENGLKWHIHEKWGYADTKDRIGSECGPSFAGGHYDPWNACGSASGNIYCMASSNTYNFSCIPTSGYSPDFTSNPFSVEVGDWSGKYGIITLDNDAYSPKIFSSYYEVLPIELKDLSVVFHCGTAAAERAFCAPFVEDTEQTSFSVPDQDDNQTVVAYFDILTNESQIMMSSDGSITATIDATGMDLTNAGCSNYEFSIFNIKDGKTLKSSSKGSGCTDVLDSQYDPTHQCLPWSDSPYCSNGILCQDEDHYQYDCVFDDKRYSCAPGDLSGKLDTKLNPSILLTLEENGPETLLPPLSKLIGKAIAFYCPFDEQESLEVLACAPIEEYKTKEDVGDIAYSVSLICTLVLTCFGLLVYV